MTGWLRHPFVLIGVRLILAAVFLAAAWPKLNDLPAFADNIKNYGMLPVSWLPLFATLLAGAEAAVGLALLASVWRRGAALLTAGMLAMFLVALGYAYASGRSIHCGCFTNTLSAEKAADIRGEMLQRIVEDVGLFALAVLLCWAEWRGGGAPTATGRSGE
jgi:uncharacterized membrane protein YphA (DoxX/SURF4 family)